MTADSKAAKMTGILRKKSEIMQVSLFFLSKNLHI